MSIDTYTNKIAAVQEEINKLIMSQTATCKRMTQVNDAYRLNIMLDSIEHNSRTLRQKIAAMDELQKELMLAYSAAHRGAASGN